MRKVNFELFDDLARWKRSDIDPQMCFTCGAIVPRPWLVAHIKWHESLEQ